MAAVIDISGSRVKKTLAEAQAKPTHGSKNMSKAAVCFRIHPQKKAMLARICELNNAHPAEYLRECVQALIREHMSPSAFEALLKECGER